MLKGKGRPGASQPVPLPRSGLHPGRLEIVALALDRRAVINAGSGNACRRTPRRMLDELRTQLLEFGRRVVKGGENERPFRVAEVDDTRAESMGCLEFVGESGVLHHASECEDKVVLHGDAVDNHANWDPPNEGLANGAALVADDSLEPFTSAPEVLLVERLLHAYCVLFVLRELFDEHASEFGESPGGVCSKHGHDSAPVVEAECDERVLVGDGPVEFHGELVSVEHAREQLHVVGSYGRPGEDHDAVGSTTSVRTCNASWAMVFLLSLDRRGGREWSGRRKSRFAYRQCTPSCVVRGVRAGARRLAEQDAAHLPRDVPPLGGRRRTRPSVKPGCMWPFRRKPASPEVDLGRRELRQSQLEITKGYGSQTAEPESDQDVLRESLERHEDDLVPVAEPPVD
jgi:hypothetical protein